RKPSMTVRDGILQQVKRRGAKTVFTPADFADLGTPHAVGMALARLVRDGTLRRAGRGLYDVPRQHPLLGTLLTDSDAIAKTLAGKHGIKLQPTGAYAANLLGLSEQVPMRVAYLTDGTPRTVRVGQQEIILRRTTPRRMAAAGRVSGLVINALRWLGRQHVTAQTLKPLRRRLDATAKRQLLADAHLAPVWVADWMRWLARDGD
ncbi:MAG: DUF6088 family protein, partial [bacterium]